MRRLPKGGSGSPHRGRRYDHPGPSRGVCLPRALVPARSPLGTSTCGGDGGGGGPVRPPPSRRRQWPRRGGGGAGRVPPYGSGKFSPLPRSPAQGGLARLGLRTAAMQETNTFLLSALQPEAGVCSLALPSDRQLDGRSREAAEAQRLRSARVQEQVRIRMMLRGQAATRPEAPDHADGGRGGRTPGPPPPPPPGARVETGGGSPLAGTKLWLALWLGVGGLPPIPAEPPEHPAAPLAPRMGAARPQHGLVSPHSGIVPQFPHLPPGGDLHWGGSHTPLWAGGEVFLALADPSSSPPAVEQRRWLGSKLLHLTSALAASALLLRPAPARGFTEPPDPRCWGTSAVGRDSLPAPRGLPRAWV